MENVKKVPFLKKTTEFDEGGSTGIVLFTLGNGQFVSVDYTELSESNRYHAAIHGISQCLGDSCAAFSKDMNYAAAFEVMTDLKAQLATPEWNRKREAGSANRQIIEDLIVAMAKLKKMDEDAIRVVVEKAPVEKLKAWTSNSKVAAEIQSIRKARAAAAAKVSNDSIDDVVFD